MAMHIAQATACTTAFVVAIVTCLGRELLRTVVRTEPEWTFVCVYFSASKQFYPTCAKMFEVVHITIV